MSEDTFTEITQESWFSRIGGAIKGIVIGLVLFIAAFPTLFWNEGRAVREYKTLNEGAGNVITLPQATVSAGNEGRLVHVTGMAETDETLVDPEFSVAVNAIKLRRKVEMYQWQEKQKRKSKKKLGGGKKTVTTYSYRKTWSSSLIDSSNFKKPNGHQNPADMLYKSRDFTATQVSLGEFNLPDSLIRQINKSSTLPVSDIAEIGHLPGAEFHGGGIYFGDSPSTPQIGDLRITYRIVAPTEISVVSRQMNGSFKPYRAEAGGTINMLSIGILPAEAMFEKAHQSNVMWTWIIRAGGFLLMLIGIAMILRPLSVIADVVPFFGSVVGTGTGILSFLIATPLACLTVALAWLRYRPVIGITLLALACVVAGLIFVLSKRGKKSRRSTPGKLHPRENQPSRMRASETAAPSAGIARTPQSIGAAVSPKNSMDMLKKGQNFFRTGQYDKAIMQFSRAIKSGGDRKSALYNRGVALFKINKKEAALKDFKHAAKLGHAKAKAVINQIKPNTA
jgi:tetratricopeptide (TPR) repeat protein